MSSRGTPLYGIKFTSANLPLNKSASFRACSGLSFNPLSSTYFKRELSPRHFKISICGRHNCRQANILIHRYQLISQFIVGDMQRYR